MNQQGESATPMMQQYYAIKREYPQEILFFRLGDFYEMFEEDARQASSILNVTLTSRNGIPMCGIPYHATKSYIKKLLDAGKRIAICEQMDMPEKGIARREVVQVVSPGTVIEDDLLTSNRNNYLFSCALLGKMLTASWIDISTGEFFLSSAPGEEPVSQLKKLLFELDPSEVLLPEALYHEHPEVRQLLTSTSAMVTPFPDWSFDIAQSYQDVLELLGLSSLQSFGISNDDPGLASVGVLIRYLRESAKISMNHIRGISLHSRHAYLMMDESTQRNLELLRNLHDGGESDTLFSVLRHTVTAAGARRLREWIIHPLTDDEQRSSRLDAVDTLYHQPSLLHTLRGHLKGMLDIPRITTRLFIGKAQPKDFYSLRQSLEKALLIDQDIQGTLSCVLEEETHNAVASCAQLISESIYYEPTLGLQYLIKPGYHEQLDSMRNYLEHSLDFIKGYEQELRELLGIPKLKVKYNKIIGYFIEVSKLHSDRVGREFIRKQTLVNSERYTTEHLLELEQKQKEAQEQFADLERQIFQHVLQEVRSYARVISTAAETASEVDCYQSLAHSAATLGFVRPEFTRDNKLIIEKGRHPVVEQSLPPGSFVPNDLTIPKDYHRFALITGPNMAGKSTYLRQNALIIIMAYMGSFVPAQHAVIGTVDRIFCRVGASDNLARGESTFLVEMHETAYILKNATDESLIIMDEVGRGTSTADGISIAAAVLQYVLRLRSKTLFATHFHELTEIDSPIVQKLFLEIHEDGDDIVFLNRVKSGSMKSSYGIHVAKLAGLPASVIRRAEVLLEQHQKHMAPDQSGLPELFSEDIDLPEHHEAVDPEIKHILEDLKAFNVQETAPLDALVFLAKLQSRLKGH